MATPPPGATRGTGSRSSSAASLRFRTCLLRSFSTGWLVWRSHSQPSPRSWHTWMAVIRLVVARQALGQGLLIHQHKRFSASFVSVLMRLEPLITAFLAAGIFAGRGALRWAKPQPNP